MENLWMCLNNLPALLPISIASHYNDRITAGCITFVSSMSAISHLLENHKHGMPGFISISKSCSYFFNRLDVLGSIMTITRFMYIYYQKYGMSVDPLIKNKGIVLMALLSMLCNMISEYDNQNVFLKNRYLLLHSIWHITIYPIMYLYLKNIIYDFTEK